MTYRGFFNRVRSGGPHFGESAPKSGRQTQAGKITRAKVHIPIVDDSSLEMILVAVIKFNMVWQSKFGTLFNGVRMQAMYLPSLILA